MFSDNCIEGFAGQNRGDIVNNIKVSFIIPAYNVEEYIHQCIDSVLEQDIAKEIIIVNDGSTDKTLEIVEDYADSHNCIRVINKVNQGLSCARNDGVAIARGEFLCFLDGDDYYLKEYASQFYKLCKRYGLDIIRGWYAKVYEDGSHEKVIHPVKFLNRPMNSYDYLVATVDQKAFEVVSVIGFIGRDYYLQNNLKFAEGLFYEDQLYYLQMLLGSQNCKVMQVNQCFYGYRIREGSITQTPDPKKLYDLIEIMQKQIQFVDELSLKGRYKTAANRIISGTMNHLISLFLRLSPYDQGILKNSTPRRLRFRALLYANGIRDFLKIFVFILSPKLLMRLFQRNRTL